MQPGPLLSFRQGFPIPEGKTSHDYRTRSQHKTWKTRLFNRPKRDYIHPYLGGLLLGLVLFLAFFITGNGLGASGGLNRIVVFVQDIFAPEHVDRIPYLIKLAGGDKNPLDDWIVPMIFGTLLGGFASGWLNGRLKVETNKGPNITVRTRWLMALIGGTFMGYGARMARGLHVRPGAVGRRSALARRVGFHVRRICRRLCAGLLRP